MTTPALEGTTPQSIDSPGSDAILFVLDLLSHWRRTLAITIVLGLLGFAASFLNTPEYGSRTSFMPEPRDRASTANAFLGLASQLGVGIGSNTATPQLYYDLIRSVIVTDSVLAMRTGGGVAGGGSPVRIAELLEPDARPQTAAWEKARADLIKRTSSSLNPRTNVIELQARMPEPAIAQAVARRYVEALNTFNRTSRQSSARLRREFAGARLTEAQDSLRDAEYALTGFLQANRNFESSPALRSTSSRLERRVQSFQEIATSLRREYESARLDEVNDQPLLTTIDAPTLPTRRMSAKRALFVLLGVALGLTLAIFSSLGRVTFIRMRIESPARYDRLVRRVQHIPYVRSLARDAATHSPLD